MFDDVCKIIMKTTEGYFDPFCFVYLQDTYHDIIQEKDERKLMQLIATYIATKHWKLKQNEVERSNNLFT